MICQLISHRINGKSLYKDPIQQLFLSCACKKSGTIFVNKVVLPKSLCHNLCNRVVMVCIVSHSIEHLVTYLFNRL